MFKISIAAFLALGSLVAAAPPKAKAAAKLTAKPAPEPMEEIHLALESPTFYTGDGKIEFKELGAAWGKRFLPYCEAVAVFSGKFSMDTIQKGEVGTYLVRGSSKLQIDRAKLEMDDRRLNHPVNLPPWKTDGVKLPYIAAYNLQLPADGVARDDWEGWSLLVELESGGKVVASATAKLEPEVFPKGKRPPLKWD